MKESSNALTFNDVLQEARSLQSDFYAAKDDIDLGPEPEAVRRFQEAVKSRLDSTPSRRRLRSAKFEADYATLSIEDRMWLAMSGMAQQRAHPFHFSGLAGYLELETWKPREALLILAGVDPGAAKVDWSYDNFLGANIERPVVRRANWFADAGDHYDQPLVSEFDHSPSELRERIRDARAMGDEKGLARLEDELAGVELWAIDPTTKYVQEMLALRSEMLHQLARIWFSADHDAEARRSPAFFVRWAESRGFQIEWTEWAREHALLDAEPPITAAPFFDADAEDYPRLLHIAVRAWDHARQSTGGTAKQRIAAYLLDRYPDLSGGERDAISTIGNWQKAGGRPKTGG